MSVLPNLPVDFPLGVADPDAARAAIFTGPASFVLLDLADGVAAETYDDLGTPLLLTKTRLFGWRLLPGKPEIRLFMLALEKGAGETWSNPVSVPDWVAMTPPEELSFSVECDRLDVRTLYWSARRTTRMGIDFSLDAPNPPLDASSEGCLRVDFDTMTLSRRKKATKPRTKSLEDLGAELALNSNATVYRQAGDLRNAPWETEDGPRFLRATSGRPGEGRRSLSLASVAALGDIGAGIDGRDLDVEIPELSLDGAHIAIPGRVKDLRVHLIHDARDGAFLFSVPFEAPLKGFRIFGSRLYYYQEETIPDFDVIVILRRLACFDLANGTERWVFALPEERVENHSQPPPGLGMAPVG